MSTPLIRIQEKGQVTIPLEIRRRLNLKKGDVVVFIETEDGVVIQPAGRVVNAALDEIRAKLQRRGVGMAQLIRSGRKLRGALIEEEYGLSDSSS